MKKKLALACVAVLSASLMLVGCGKDKPADTKDPIQTEPTNVEVDINNNSTESADSEADNNGNSSKDEVIENPDGTTTVTIDPEPIGEDTGDDDDDTPAEYPSDLTLEKYVYEYHADELADLEDELANVVEKSDGLYTAVSVEFVGNNYNIEYHFGDFGLSAAEMAQFIPEEQYKTLLREMAEDASEDTGIPVSDIKITFSFYDCNGNLVASYTN